MKKKFLSIIAVSAALATAGSALVACGGGEDSAKTEVTKQQWAAALAVDNFTSNFNAYMKMQEGTDTKGMTEEYTLVVGPEKFGDYSLTFIRTRNGAKYREVNDIRIVVGDSENLYYRTSEFDDDGKWDEGYWLLRTKDRFEYDNDEWQESVLNYLGFKYYQVFADKYDSFKYSNGAYVLTGDGIEIDNNRSEGEGYYYSYKITATKATIKFESGKLTSVEMTLKNESESKYDDEEVQNGMEEFTCVLKVAYGAQKITAPDNVVVDNGVEMEE